MKILLVITAILLVQSTYSQSLFKPIPKPKGHVYALSITPSTDASSGAAMWSWRPMATAPIFRYQKGSFNATTIGGGISYQHLVYDAINQRYNSTISLSPATFLVGQNNGFDFSYAGTVGFFNNILLFGGGYDFSQKAFFGLITLGVQFNN